MAWTSIFTQSKKGFYSITNRTTKNAGVNGGISLKAPLFIHNADAVFTSDLVSPTSPPSTPDPPKVVKDKTDTVLAPTDIDLKIPETGMSNLDGIAVVIGNKTYEHFDDVEFAGRDAHIMKEYLLKTLGYRENNIIFVENATKTDFEEVFGSTENYQGKIWKAAAPI